MNTTTTNSFGAEYDDQLAANADHRRRTARSDERRWKAGRK